MTSTPRPPTPYHARSARRAPRWAYALALLAATAATGCSPPLVPAGDVAPAPWDTLPAPEVLLLGEQHDAPAHQQLQHRAVTGLAAQGRLAGLVLEMAERGRTTKGLPADASAPQVQQALQWNESAWPWVNYGPMVMAAVAAGVPVWGGNLPRHQMREALQDAGWDQHLPPEALARQHRALREGHCGLLPPEQIAPMARIQIARDASLAQVARSAGVPGRTVVLVAGAGHVLRSLGVPTHWPQDFPSNVVVAVANTDPSAPEYAADADHWVHTPAPAPRDHCAALRERWTRPSRGG